MRLNSRNYLCSLYLIICFQNGDAHLKNFAILEIRSGDYILSPAYDLVNTRLHVDDTDFALDEGLFKEDFKSESARIRGHAGIGDFNEFADRLGIKDSRRSRILEPFLVKQPYVETLIERSFLSEPAKRAYLLEYQTRRNRLTR